MDRRPFLLWVLLLAYLAARILQLFSGRVPSLVIVGLHVLPPALFAIIHGARIYGMRGILTFAALCFGTGTISESLSLRTGFPFGRYEFTELMGPKLFDVPIMLALAYFGMGYLSWVVSIVILGLQNEPLSAKKLIRLSLTAGLVMTTWDLSMEAVWADIDRAWVWHDGGPFFGVPVSNFFGWFFTAYVFYQLFALYLRNDRTSMLAEGQYRLPILFYGLLALGNFLVAVPATSDFVFIDAAGKPWRISDIMWASYLVSLLLMFPLSLIAWIKTFGTTPLRTGR